jgi:hypothetical protein
MTIPYLPIGTSYTIQYGWTPTEYGAYNFTVFATPLPLESYVGNNNITRILYIIDTNLFDGLFMKYNFSSMMYSYETNLSYSFYNGRFFYETWNINNTGIIISYSWIVDAQTRVMSGNTVFGDGYHTPFWVFIDISINDTVPIAVDGIGDHDFRVIRDLAYNFPGFGTIEVWELNDLTQPGGIALYEKSTGILISGTFLYSDFNYTIKLTATNAALNILSKPKVPGYYLPTFILSIFTIITLVITLKFKKSIKTKS